jgi:hypothetical protein
MPSRTKTHHLGGTSAGTQVCLDAISKAVESKGFCTEVEARGMAMSLYPTQVLVRVGAQKLKNRPKGTSCRYASEVDTYMKNGAVSPDAVEWFRINGGNRQLARLKQFVLKGRSSGITYCKTRKEFVRA